MLDLTVRPPIDVYYWNGVKGSLTISEGPKLNITERELLDSPITLEELKEAVAQTKNNKAPGPDGLPMEIYRKMVRSYFQNWRY